MLYTGLELDWAGAESFCVASGGHLASVHSEQDLEELAQLMLEEGFGRAWIGGTDLEVDSGSLTDLEIKTLILKPKNLEVEGEWKWTDDTEFNFTR